MSESIYQDINPVFDGEYLSGYSIDHDEEAIKNSLLNLFTISKGDVPGKPYLGNPLDLQLFDLFDFFTKTDMETAIINTLQKYEPRINLISIEITEAQEYNRIIIKINYSFVINNIKIYDSLDVPYSHNTISYLGGRVRPNTPKNPPSNCN